MRARLSMLFALTLLVSSSLSAAKGASDFRPSDFLVSDPSPRVEVPPVPDELNLDAAAVMERYGPPSFAVSNLLVYAGRYAGIAVDVSFYFVDGMLSEIAFGFPVDGLGPGQLRRHADRVLKRLRVEYGAPATRSSVDGEFKAHVWRSEAGELVHRVVYRGGARHELRATRSRSIGETGVSDEWRQR